LDGERPDNFYAIGVSGTTNSFILHHDGIGWREELFTNSNSQFLTIRHDRTGIFISCLKPNLAGSDTMVLYKYENDQLVEIFSESLSTIIFASINKIGEGAYFLLGRTLNKYINGKFIKVASFTESSFGFHVYGRNEKDLFVRMRDGLAHYNGVNLEYLYHFSNNFTSIFNNPLIFDNEVFFAVYDYVNGNNLILHGKLKK
jgi:hypothetical protein